MRFSHIEKYISGRMTHTRHMTDKRHMTAAVYCNVYQVYRKEAIDKSTCHQWFDKFREGD